MEADISPNSCKTRGKFDQEMPKTRNVTLHYDSLDTNTAALLVEWDTSNYIKMSPSIWDRFEVQVRSESEWKEHLTRTLNATYENAYHGTLHFALPYQKSEIGTVGDIRFRIRRVWTRPCVHKKVSNWVYSKTTNIAELEDLDTDIVANIDQLNSNSVLISLASNSKRLEAYRICWKPEVHGAVVSKSFTCHETVELDVYQVKFEIGNLDKSYQIWTFSVTDKNNKKPPVLLTTLLVDQEKVQKPEFRTGGIRYKIDSSENRETPCNLENDAETSALHGSIIGVLAVFLLFCVVVIIFICRMRNKKRDSEETESIKKERTPPPRYSDEDHEIFLDNERLEPCSGNNPIVKCIFDDKFNQFPTRVQLPPISTFKENLKDYNSLSTIPYQGTLQTRSEICSQSETS